MFTSVFIYQSHRPVLFLPIFLLRVCLPQEGCLLRLLEEIQSEGSFVPCLKHPGKTSMS